MYDVSKKIWIWETKILDNRKHTWKLSRTNNIVEYCTIPRRNADVIESSRYGTHYLRTNIYDIYTLKSSAA